MKSVFLNVEYVEWEPETYSGISAYNNLVKILHINTRNFEADLMAVKNILKLMEVESYGYSSSFDNYLSDRAEFIKQNYR